MINAAAENFTTRRMKMEKMKPGLLSLASIGLWPVIGVSNQTGQTQAGDIHQWGATPPMGWSSWDIFGTAITEKQVRELPTHEDGLFWLTPVTLATTSGQ